MSAVSSSWTIFTTCWPGVRLLRTSCPSARSLTDAVKSRATSRFTSASSRARRISRIAFEIGLLVEAATASEAAERRLELVGEGVEHGPTVYAEPCRS